MSLCGNAAAAGSGRHPAAIWIYFIGEIYQVILFVARGTYRPLVAAIPVRDARSVWALGLGIGASV